MALHLHQVLFPCLEKQGGGSPKDILSIRPYEPSQKCGGFYFNTIFINMNIKKIIKEEIDDFDWVRDINPTTYKFFDIYVCFSYDYNEDYCVDGYSAFVKIPTHIADEIWGGYIGYMGGPGDEGVGVIEWSIDNEQLDMEDVAAIDYVLEIDEDEYMRATGDPDLL